MHEQAVIFRGDLHLGLRHVIKLAYSQKGLIVSSHEISLFDTSIFTCYDPTLAGKLTKSYSIGTLRFSPFFLSLNFLSFGRLCLVFPTTMISVIV